MIIFLKSGDFGKPWRFWKTLEILENSSLAVSCKQGNRRCSIVTRRSLVRSAFLIGRPVCLTSVGDTLPLGCFYHLCKQDYFLQTKEGKTDVYKNTLPCINVAVDTRGGGGGGGGGKLFAVSPGITRVFPAWLRVKGCGTLT